MFVMFDDTVIARQSAAAGALCVLAQRHEVMWRDGTAVQLHPVHANGRPMIMHRAVQMPGGRMLLIDLTRLVRALDAELRTTPDRDQVGHVFYRLRQAFASARLFNEAAERTALGTWWPVAGGYTWMAAPRAIDPSLVASMPAPAAAPADCRPWSAQ